MNYLPRSLRLLTALAFQDNYLWLIHDGVHAAAIDPGASVPIFAALAAHKLTLTTILLTHHHADHTGGVANLLRATSVPVFGPRNDCIDVVSVALGEGDLVDVPGLALRFGVLDVPGHTLGHIAYVRQTPGAHWLFCGDTLFARGCGRIFEGMPAQMSTSLTKLTALPDDALVFCAHEYTLTNLRFISRVEPGNAQLRQRVAIDGAKRAAGLATAPSSIALGESDQPVLALPRAANC